MHSIISFNKNLKIGAKAKNLIKLDALSLCPNFIVLDNSVFLEHIKDYNLSSNRLDRSDLKRFILKKEMDVKLRRLISRDVCRLGIKKPIVRSSFPKEDSLRHSYAGLFESIKTRPTELVASIKKIWASQFNELLDIYIKKKKISSRVGMAVIIQEYLAPEWSGVMFHCSKTDDTFIEFTDSAVSGVENGSVVPKTIVIHKGILMMNEQMSLLKLPWIKELLFAVKTAPGHFNCPDFDAEFVVHNGKISFVQLRNITKRILPSGKFIFLDLHTKKISNKDISIGFLGSYFKKLGLRINLNQVTYANDAVLLGYKAFLEILDNLYSKALSKNFIERFYNRIIAFQKLEEIQSIKKFDIKRHIIYLKQYRVTVFMADALINLMMQLLKWKLSREGKEETTHPALFRPFKMTLSSLVLLKSLEECSSGRGLTSHSFGLIESVNAAKLEKLRNRLRDMAHHKKSPVRTDISNLQKLIWLHDANNFFIEAITRSHEVQIQKIAGISTLSILCKTPLAKLKTMACVELIELLKNPVERYKKTDSKDVRLKDLKFPLEGMVACPGNFKGRARVVPFLSGIKNIHSDEILITRETSPRLVAAMAVCRGVITEVGGLTSHAAIISRELNVPCVVGVKECLGALKSGDQVKVINGKVYKKFHKPRKRDVGR